VSTGPDRAGPSGAPPVGFGRGVAGLDHVGLVVEDLEAASEALERVLGPPLESRALPEVGLEARIFQVGSVAVEVLRFRGPVPGIDPGVTRARQGIHHLAFRVPDLEAVLARLASAGVRPLEGFPRPGLHGPIAFVRDPITGALVELVQGEGGRDA